MAKMASPESNRESGKSDLQKPDAQQLDGTTSSNDSINQEKNEVDSVVNAEEKKNSTSDKVNECANIQEKNTDNAETVQNELNDVKTEKDENVRVSQMQEIKTDKEDIAVKEESALKRKRKPLSVPADECPATEESETRPKRKKRNGTEYDEFCWRCHKEGVDVYCTACPRSWHRKCIGGMPPSLDKWICGECAAILKAENAETCSSAMALVSLDQLCMLLKFVVEKLRDYPGAEPFCKPVDLTEVPNYLDYVVKPMDLSILESNVQAKLYGSTDAFMADAKWIQHNCIVFNTCGGVYTDTSKLTNAAKHLVKVARQEVSEIEACPDCYASARNLPRRNLHWFIEPCRKPHPLVWAKLKGFPFWPAKAMPRVNPQGYVDVRFFGEHDRAWVSQKDLYLYSEEPPAPSSRKRKPDMDECMREITKHCRKLALMFGQFKFAPPKVQYDPNDPMQIKLLLPNYNPLEPYSQFSNTKSSTSKKKTSPKKKGNDSVKDQSQSDETTAKEEIDSKSKENTDDIKKETETPEVQNLDADDIKNSSKINQNQTPNKLSKKENEEVVMKENPEVATIVQNEVTKNEKSKSAKASQPIITNNAIIGNSSVNSSANEPEKAKDETKPSSKLASLPSNESSDVIVRTQKKTLLKDIINPKPALSQIENAARIITKHAKNNNNKIYKPKTRLVDKLNAEKALKSTSASKENEKQMSSNSSGTSNMPLNHNGELSSGQKISEMDITSSTSSPSNTKVTQAIMTTRPLIPVTDKPMMLLVVNKGKPGAVNQATNTIDPQSNKDAVTVNTKEVRKKPLQAKESKARKTFPNRPRNPPISVQSPPSDKSSKRETSSTYRLTPPEAGPISARLHHNANELARRMGQLMEEAYKEAAEINSENGDTDDHQATVFFLRMQIEHLKWQHQQQLAEIKHNTDRTLREMRASMEAEKVRLVEETRREGEEEKLRCIEEIKKKQWCAYCGQEAMFYCCWNTAYCDYPCQQSHWPTHMQTCSQQSAPSQQSNNMTHDSVSRIYALPSSKLSGIPPS
ncbi:protein kinase C-binding protein 1 isoform X2 [Pseudomyrmex gracilis]|uniref:protein kinase C-binding protein 1 isoform X2 n=1 Tax=Pseudomyrmex gracilis TaxID=219809 RepID=UPI0009951DA9|nr:protein kinase C-binding protein 1 isoform X2 [Pseudomyrmex gracilis]